MKYLFFVIFYLISLQSIAQPGFSNTYEMSSPGSDFHNIIWDGENIVVVGAARVDSLNQWGILFAKFDTLGNLLNHKIYVDTIDGDTYVFEPNFPVIQTFDGGYLMTGTYFYNKWGFVIKLDSEGELEFSIPYPEAEIKTYYFREAIEVSDGYIIGGSKQIQNFHSQSFVLKINLDGEFLWEKKYGTVDDNTAIGSLHQVDENTFLIGAAKSVFPFGPPFNYTDTWGKGWIFAIDSVGVIKWEWESELNEETIIMGLKKTDDGGYLYSTGEFVIHNMFQAGTIRKIIKRGINFDLEWEIEMSPNAETYNFSGDIQPTPDGNWVALGYWATPDSTIMYEEKWYGGCHYKFSPQGDSIWSRCDTVVSPDNIHSQDALGGIAVLPSGSIISAGKANEYDNILGHRSLGWLVKIDQNGCLDTLCNFATAIPELSFSRELEVLVYPNPVTDYLSVQKEINEALDYQITDLNGRITMEGVLIDEVQNIDFTKISSGIYFIKITNPKTRDYIIRKIVK
jgi:hypothetical protein